MIFIDNMCYHIIHENHFPLFPLPLPPLALAFFTLGLAFAFAFLGAAFAGDLVFLASLVASFLIGLDLGALLAGTFFSLTTFSTLGFDLDLVSFLLDSDLFLAASSLACCLASFSFCFSSSFFSLAASFSSLSFLSLASFCFFLFSRCSCFLCSLASCL